MAQGLADAVLLGLLAAAPELLAVAQRGADVAADPIVWSGLACGRYSRLTQEDLAAEDGQRAGTLPAHGGGQHHIHVVVGPGTDVSDRRKDI